MGDSWSLRFVNDLDRLTIMALVGSASKYPSPSLRNALYDYLAAESLIEVSISVSKASSFLGTVASCPRRSDSI